MQLTLFPLPAGTGDDELDVHYAGRRRVPCVWCGGRAVEGSVCPRSLRCPTCGRGPGQRCKRPSEHDAAEMHATRWQAAEAIDRQALAEQAEELATPVLANPGPGHPDRGDGGGRGGAGPSPITFGPTAGGRALHGR